MEIKNKKKKENKEQKNRRPIFKKIRTGSLSIFLKFSSACIDTIIIDHGYKPKM